MSEYLRKIMKVRLFDITSKGELRQITGQRSIVLWVNRWTWRHELMTGMNDGIQLLTDGLSRVQRGLSKISRIYLSNHIVIISKAKAR